MFISSSLASLTPVSSVTIPSTTLAYSSTDEGSWQITKSASWLSKGKARINIKLNTVEKLKSDYTDVILVLDTSGSMIGSKLTQVQTDINNLINDTIPKGNKIALITFSDSATIVSDFTDDTTTLQESINNLVASGETNYYQALVKVDEILSTYTKEDNKNCVVLFLTDGLPTIDTPNEVGEYKYLKSKYEYLDINGIQYELGSSVLTGIKNITDNQFIANKESLNEFLYTVTLSTAIYDEFILTDYVDTNYFNLDNVTDITTSLGTASIKDNKVTWNLDNLKSGSEAELTIDINLNSDLIGKGGIYPTHTETDVYYKIGNTSLIDTSTKTTVLKDNYTVNYDMNTPVGCTVSNVPSSKTYSVFDTVTVDDSTPTCEGYQFSEWKIVTDVEKVGTNSFIMPESDVTIKATWKKLSVKKSMDGKIAKVQTLYKLIADNSLGLDTDIDFSKSPTDDNSGVYTIASTADDTYPVHYYRGNIDNNNVLFAGFCWKMVRTTSTGGVKLIYNGVYDKTNKCNNTGEDTQIGTSRFNYDYMSPADVGYMYGTRYEYNSSSSSNSVNVLNRTLISSDSNYYYGDSITYSNGTYTLNNSSLKSWSDNYSNLAGYYTCRSTSTTCSEVYYIAGTTSDYQYTLSLENGVTNPDTQTITLGKNIIDNGDGTYTLSDIETIKRVDWYTDYNRVGYYICEDLTSTTCNGKYIIKSTFNNQILYEGTLGLVYGNDVSWDGSKYILIDTYTSISGWSDDRTTLVNKYHYTCLNTTGECSQVYYIHYFGFGSTIYYLTLSSGKDIEDAKDEMFTNTTDSTMKKTIDTWYKNNMTNYTKKLEDTVFCNDRTLYSGSLAGKDIDAGTDYSYFSAYNRTNIKYTPSVICLNDSRDGFTVSTVSGGNGKLTYPVGLLTADEVLMAGGCSSNSEYYLYTGTYYWVLSPARFDNYYAVGFFVNSNGSLGLDYVFGSFGARPVISLVTGIKATDGAGTVDNPYIVL